MSNEVWVLMETLWEVWGKDKKEEEDGVETSWRRNTAPRNAESKQLLEHASLERKTKTGSNQRNTVSIPYLED